MGATPEAAVIGEGEGACVSPGGNRGSAPGRSSITTQRGNSEDQDWELTRARVAGRHRRWGVFLARRGDFRRNWDRNGVAVSHWTGISGRKRHATSACPILVARGIHLYNWIRCERWPMDRHRCGQPPALRKGRGPGPETPSPGPTPGVGSRGQGNSGTI